MMNVKAIEISAGGVVFRKKEDIYEVILFRKKSDRCWGLPKGKLEPGETAQEAALREVREETGAEAEIIGDLGEVHYRYRNIKRKAVVDKTVYFFLMKYLTGNIGSSEKNIDAVGWFSFDTAIEKATHESERAKLQTARSKLPDIARQ
ncbi:MAG: NUDIX hydrolase [Candidatus Omnitrophica bacterium]|nr:NUDIX hydrolase [Candidatus Omnitrophota bacterium]